MFKRTALSLLLVLSVVAAGFSFQQRITTHKTYTLCDSDGAGSIYFILSESGQNDDIWKINSTGTGLTRITNMTNPVKLFKLLPGSEKAVVVTRANDTDTITLMNSDGSTPQILYSGELYITQIAVSPDSQKLAFTARQPSFTDSYRAIYTINIDGTGLKLLSLDHSSKPKKIAGLGAFTVETSSFTKNIVYPDDVICFSSGSDHVLFRTTTTGRIQSVETTGSIPVDLSPSYSYMGPYCAKSGKIYFVESTGEQSISCINLDGSGYTVLYSTVNIYSFAFSPDESKIALNSPYGYQKNILVVSDTGTFISQTIIEGNFYLSEIKWISGTKIGFTDYSRRDINAANSDGSGYVNITANDSSYPAWLLGANGDKCVYGISEKNSFEADSFRPGGKTRKASITATDKVYITGVKTVSPELLKELPDHQYWYNTSVSPDGSKIAYEIEITSPVNEYSLRVINADGTGETTLLHSPSGSYYGINWSKTGNYFIFYSSDSQRYLARPDGSSFRRFVPDGVSAAYPMFSDNDSMFFQSNDIDGHGLGIYSADINLSTYTLVFSSANTSWVDVRDCKAGKLLIYAQFNSAYKLLVMNLDGSNIAELSDKFSGGASMRPDGTKVVYQNYEDPFYKLYLSNADGSSKTVLDTNLTEINFNWSQDGKKFVYMNSGRPEIYDSIMLLETDPDGSNPKDINPFISGFHGWDFIISGNDSIVYTSQDGDIWTGDFNSFAPQQVAPETQGEVRVVIPEDAGQGGTINPDSGQPVAITFKGSGEGTFKLKIFTQLGELVYEATKEVTSADGWFDWLPGNLSSGVYLVYIEGPGVKKYQKIAILK